MKVSVVEKGDREIKFLLEETNPQFGNALRRIMVSEIPILAVKDVDFYSNDSVLYDEVVAHRLALIPLVFNPNDFNFKDDCSCEGKGCSNCQIILVINKKGPGMVYSKDIKSSNPSVKPLHDDFPIVELKEGQKLKMEGTAILGLGKDHAKWQPANVHYRYYPLAKLTGKINNLDDVIKSCPKRALKIGSKAEVSEPCDLCGECLKVAEPKGALEVKGDPTRLIFNVESVSGLTAEQLVLEAVNILKKKAKDFSKEAKRIK